MQGRSRIGVICDKCDRVGAGINFTYIYTLVDPRTSDVFYVGKANNPRDRFHASHNEATENRIKKIEKSGNKVLVKVVEKVTANGIKLTKRDWLVRENFWIEKFKKNGYLLLNENAGGSGPTGMSLKLRKYFSKIGTGRKTGPITEEHREKLRIAHLGLHHSLETKKKIGLVGKGRINSEETKEKMRLAAIKRNRRPSYIKRHREGLLRAAAEGKYSRSHW